MRKNIKKMTKRELEKEYNIICQQIDELSFGTNDITYRTMLENEIDKRGYRISVHYKLIS